jgi:soluble lytic murein transglycosylase-like protein
MPPADCGGPARSADERVTEAGKGDSWSNVLTWQLASGASGLRLQAQSAKARRWRLRAGRVGAAAVDFESRRAEKKQNKREAVMQARPFHALIGLIFLGLAGCAGKGEVPAEPEISRALYPNETPELRALIEEYSDFYDVPDDLVHRVVIRESRHQPGARNGPYYGLMQILPQTARTMGYQGRPEGLLDAETNLKYAVKYLRGAWLVADGNPDAAVGWYARGYYYEAKRKGLLKETGLR